MQRLKQLGLDEYDITTGPNGPGSCIIGMSILVGQGLMVQCCS
ncbi:hypothetical protein [Bacillus thuringiensis]|nr:hypothetical protein [Bacillus thuringiensis]